MKNKAQQMIDRIMNSGATYADIRLHLVDQTEHISIMKDTLDNYSCQNKVGFGIRVLYNGAWGFASSEKLDLLDQMANKALSNAKASSTFIKNKITLAPKNIHKATYITPRKINPFEINLDEKINELVKISKSLSHPSFEIWNVSSAFYNRKILFLDSEGSEIEKNLLEVNGSLFLNAKDKDSQIQRRHYTLPHDPKGTTGFESILSNEFSGQAETLKSQLLQLVVADEAKAEVCDLLILPEMMALQTHETIGHALELDRILGYELSYAGGSHVTLNDFGKKQFGSKKLTARADATNANSPGSTGFDDDGVEAQNTTLIDQGILVGAITSRQMVAEANQLHGKEIFKKSGGCSRSESYNRMPIDRMTNINIDAGNDGNLEDLISSIEDGIMVDSAKSWSIGSNRENFHFATEVAWKIKNGKKGPLLKNATYRADSMPFWNSLIKVGNASTCKQHVFFTCGKGQPNQAMRLGHHVPVCVFNNVQIGK
ncbi:MAG: hypothetical protein A2381_18600 [Bdellovibrionales bacterium RIFOXYB1_FULL_37_110]|nr:MAG: hypothetical protein A2417_01170 [Bdellovibrionales bacterium RIFOXYC1_FULL_37_79]OFZ59040.1 MAG: hypothetical protein A2381_18600 [Bdellovibrionales bacterium RIFOXYB1_FULL_37_110]OFZ65145.1 MAG: hypothetical protein A2577_04915 [Bdellovibrionales bacterium RIFOXYD1_FULL_36_51]